MDRLYVSSALHCPTSQKILILLFRTCSYWHNIYFNENLKLTFSIKGTLGRPRRRWEDNIKMDLQEMGWGCGDWMELAQDRDRWRALVRTVMNLRVPKMRGIS